MSNIKQEQKLFFFFLFIHLLVWSSIGLIRSVLPTDALECIYWGSLHDFGTPKHPPLAGWLSYITYLPFKTDFVIYLLSQIFIITGLIYVYRIAKIFLDDNSAMLSVIMLEGCWVYSYITGYYGFNPDVVLLCLLPVITFYFYSCMHNNRLKDWVALGLTVGLSFLNKYQTGFVIIAMAVYAFLYKKETFKNKFFYLSIIIAFLVFLPHLLWLFKYDFFSFSYFENELSSVSWYNHLTAPMQFIIMQISLIAGTIILFMFAKWKAKSVYKFNDNYKNNELMFLLLNGCIPIILHLIMGIIEGGTVRGRWGFEFWYLFSITLLYIFPMKVTKEVFISTTKLAFGVMFIIFLSLGTLLAVEKNYRSRYPVKQVFYDIKTIWANQVNTPLKYVGGYIEWTLPLTIYGDTHPKCILDTFNYKNIWINQEDLKQSGIFIIDRTAHQVIAQTKKSCPYLDENYKIKPIEYKFTLTNALNMPREYTVYYVIIPPIK